MDRAGIEKQIAELVSEAGGIKTMVVQGLLREIKSMQSKVPQG